MDWQLAVVYLIVAAAVYSLARRYLRPGSGGTCPGCAKCGRPPAKGAAAPTEKLGS